jgi:hypothetical protein
MNCAAIFQGIVDVAQLFPCHRIQKTETLRGAIKIGRTHKVNSWATFMSCIRKEDCGHVIRSESDTAYREKVGGEALSSDQNRTCVRDAKYIFKPFSNQSALISINFKRYV